MAGRAFDSGWVRPIQAGDQSGIAALLAARWGTSRIVTHAGEQEAGEWPGFLVREEDGRLGGVVTLSIEGPACEIVTIDAVAERRGIGTALLARAEQYAREQGCNRIRLVTTNDNLLALGFSQRRGYRITALRPDAVTRSPKRKPEIPEVAPNGIPIRDKLELEKAL